METIILGLLMIRSCTIYEMRKTIETNLTNISSNSIGSIQASIKKLLQNKYICFHEFVENSVNKKVYEITEEGKRYFQTTISQPMRYKEKSMELGKFFFMGFVEQNKRQELIESYISELNKELMKLEQVKMVSGSSFKEKDYEAMLQEQTFTKEITTDNIQEIALFQWAMLELSIQKIKLEIDWFQDFIKKLP